MHNRGRSRDMYREAVYDDAPGAIRDQLEQSIAAAVRAGIPAGQVILDPGLGFAKKAEHSYQALAALDSLALLRRPILAGPSRKSFLRAAIGDVPPDERDWASAAAVTASVLLGAHIVRVHAVREMVQVARVSDAILAARRPDHGSVTG